MLFLRARKVPDQGQERLALFRTEGRQVLGSRGRSFAAAALEKGGTGFRALLAVQAAENAKAEPRAPGETPARAAHQMRRA